MGYGTPSGTRSFDPSGAELLIDAFDRCGIYSLTNKHLVSGRRSMSLLLNSDWANRGINLWEMVEVVIPLYEGVTQYNFDRSVAAVYDCFRREYAIGSPVNFAVSFTTTLNSKNVSIAIAGQSAPVGSYVQIQVPVSVGGIVLSGFYLVTAQPTANSITVQAASAATSGTTGGAVPSFTTTLGSQNVTVTLNDHGYFAGQSFVVGISTQVGGITLYGSYVIQSITDANNFVIQATSAALSGATISENGGQVAIALTDTVQPYEDILMTQLSRSDYAAQSYKQNPGPPTTLWINKQIIPQANLWPDPDGTSPYELHAWCLQQIQDVTLQNGETLDLVPRMYYALVMDLARDLSMKFAPKRYPLLKQEATECWDRAASADIEQVSSFIIPNVPTGLT